MAKAIYNTPTHRNTRAALKPTVDAGHAHCTEIICLEERDGRTRWIQPGTRWDLAHDRTQAGAYLGPAHARCNRAEGARHGNKQRGPTPHRNWTL